MSKRLWLCLALIGCITSASIPLTARGSDDDGRRRRPTAPPTQAPATVEIQGTTSGVVLEWSAVPGAAAYRVFRGIAGVWNPEPIATVSWRRFRDRDLKNGIVHAYKIAAINRAGTGPQSAEASATPLAPPSELVAVSGNQQVALKWQPSAGASGYLILRRTGDQPLRPAGTSMGPTFVDTGLTNGTLYIYRVRAVAANSQSLSSPRATATPGGGGTAPTIAPTVTATGGDGRVDLSWNSVADATGYKVFRVQSGVAVMPPLATVTTTAYRHQPLPNGTPVSYQVAATNTVGDGPLSAVVNATPTAPPAAPANLTAVAGDARVMLSWTAVTGATSYKVYRGTAANGQSATALTPDPTTPASTDTTVTNGTTYFYKVTAVVGGQETPRSNEASATPTAVPLTPPTNLTASGGDARVMLSWTAVTGATSYKVYRGTAANGQSATALTPDPTTAAFTDTTVTNGTTYFYKVTAIVGGQETPRSNEASATPSAAPLTPPTNLTAVGGDMRITLSWTAVASATSYRVYRGTTSNAQAATPLTPDPTSATFLDTAVTNGTTYFYKVTAIVGGQETPRSNETSATPSAGTIDVSTLSAFRLLRQATWGPRPGEVDSVKTMGAAAFIDDQLNRPPSDYPDSLYDMSVEGAQEHWMQLALNGQDQLRQRVAWALHKILVVSAADANVNRTRAIVPYYRLLMSGAFSSYRDVLRSITLNAAMGRYLNMLNNRKQTFDANGNATSPPPNENYARELLQLFTWGTSQLNQDGTPLAGGPPTYTEEDVKALSRILTGWTFGDGNAAVPPGSIISNGDYTQPMEPVESQHDRGQKSFMLADFPANVDARAELEHVLDVIFGHPNLAPFISRQLIQQLVTSNPRPQYVSDIAGVFSSSSGNLGAIVRAILLHDDARGVTPVPAKLSEPVLFTVSMLRGLNATVTDFPFLSDLTPEMGQNVFFPGSVFSYFSPNSRVPNSGTPPLFGPEFQILTSVTALERANFVGRVLAGSFGSAVTIDYAPFTSLAATPDALLDHVNQLFMGGRMSDAERARIRTALLTTTNATERARTAIYVTLIAAQAQVDN